MEEQRNERSPDTASDMVRDPACGMEIPRASASGSVEHGGRTYYFCSASCEQKFRRNPEAYGERS